MTSFIISVAIGAAVWLVLPAFLDGIIKKKSNRKAAAMLCKIIGIVIIVLAVIDLVSGLFEG